MNEKFTLSDIESFFEVQLKMKWINRTIFDYKVQGYRKANDNDFQGEVYILKLRKKNKDIYQDVLIDDDHFVLYNEKKYISFEKDVSKEWKNYRTISREL